MNNIKEKRDVLKCIHSLVCFCAGAYHTCPKYEEFKTKEKVEVKKEVYDSFINCNII